MKPHQQAQRDQLKIDPVAMRIVNRVATGSYVRGDLAFEGGLLIQGELRGAGYIGGHTVIWAQALLVGHFRIKGDLYIFGTLGDADEAENTVVECSGTAYLAQTAKSFGTLLATQLRLYEGSQVSGPIKTTKPQEPKPAKRRFGLGG